MKDVVGVYTQNFTPVFPGARPVRANIRETARVMEHPLETGAVITDHRIILPTEIELDMVLQAEDYLEAYRQIKQYFLNGTLLLVQTRAAVYPNQIIAEMPHEENPDMYNTLTMGLRLKQVLFAIGSFSINPSSPSNQSTVQRGQQNGTTIPTGSGIISAFPSAGL